MKGEACGIIYGTHFLFLFLFFFSLLFFFFFFLSWMWWGVRNLIGIQFVFLYNVRDSATCRLLIVFQLTGHTFHFLWYCKERADSSHAVFAERVFNTSWSFCLFVCLLSYFRSILGTSFSVDHTCHVAIASTFALWREIFSNKWKKKGYVLFCQFKYIAFQFSIWASVIKLTLEKNVLLRQTNSIIFQLQ